MTRYLMPCECDCHEYGYRYDDEDNFVGCFDCDCPEFTAAEVTAWERLGVRLTMLAERMGERTIDEFLRAQTVDEPHHDSPTGEGEAEDSRTPVEGSDHSVPALGPRMQPTFVFPEAGRGL
jgi:hypothetical protein